MRRGCPIVKHSLKGRRFGLISLIRKYQTANQFPSLPASAAHASGFLLVSLSENASARSPRLRPANRGWPRRNEKFGDMRKYLSDTHQPIDGSVPVRL